MKPTTPIEAAQELVEWVTTYDGDVGHTAFRDACYEVASKAARPMSLRIPHGLDGLTLLDFADCLMHTSYAMSLAVRFPRLPGAKHFEQGEEL